MTTRIPRYLTRPSDDGRDPIRQTFKAYGVTDPVPLETRLEWSRDGIAVETYAKDDEGTLICHQDAHGRNVEPVRIRRYYPHPSS